MIKFSSYTRLNKQQRQQALLELCQALVVVKKLNEAAKLLGDLLSEQEMEMIAKRLQIAKLLLKKKTYNEIRNELKVSDTTIARVNLWLQQAGDGFRTVISRGLIKKDMKMPAWMPAPSHNELVRRFPLYYWPQNLLQQIIRIANNRQRKQILETLQSIHITNKSKRELFRYLEELVREPQQNPRRRQKLEKESLVV